jgi:hypothetical protein
MKGTIHAGNAESLIRDGDIATNLSLSKSWVRKQRFSRRHGLPHVLNIDPVMIGACPRYSREEFLAWLERQKVGRRGVTRGEG